MKDRQHDLAAELESARARIQELESAELAQSRLAAIVESAEDAIISKTLDGIITSWNPGAERIFGYTAEEIIGKPLTLLIPPDHPDEETNILDRLRRGERIDHYETQRVRKDGRIIYVSLTVSPIRDKNQTIIGASKIARDITSRKEEELASLYLRAIVESADDAIVGKTLDGIVTSWNPGAERLFGYTATEMIGSSITRIFPPDLLDEESRILAQLRRGERIDHFETRRVHKNGHTVDVSVTVSPIRNYQGQVVGGSKIARDITERKRAERRMHEVLKEAQVARERAESANRVKDDFLATISHELRTPLTAMVGWIRMLRSGSLDAEKIEKALDVIDRNVRSQAQLVEDLLDISRITMGRLRLQVRPLEPGALITAAVEALKLAAEAKNVQVKTILDSDAGPIAGDFERLQQVIWNLLSNAIKFTPKGGHVQVSLERVDSHIEMRIADDGRGIAPDFLPHVFERFRQADAVTTRRHGGIGMGLAISKAIVELHGGTISVESEGEGKGTTFIVSLPLMPVKRALSKDGVHPRAQTNSVMDCPPEVAGLSVLVVDDDPDTCDMIREILASCGAVVRTATSAEDALDFFQTARPDLLISDIGMPNVDGYSLIKRVRERERQTRDNRVPAVALTAFARIEDRVKALASGYQMHVAKPVEPTELLTIVASLSGFVEQ